MAKLGEGDPRWIVEERDDATNVNNWHWREKDVFNWSKEKLNSLISQVAIKASDCCFKFTTATFDGVATLSVRKGKIKKIIDIEIGISFEAYMADDESTIFKGTVNIPEMTYDTDPSDLQFNVSFNDQRHEKLFAFIKNQCKSELANIVKSYKLAFDEEISHDLILPIKNTQTAPSSTPATTNSTIKQMVQETEKFVQSVPSVKVDTSAGVALNIEESFNIPPQELFDFFINPEKMMLITNSPAFIKATVGGEFSFLDGSISGTYESIEQGKTIVMNWRMRTWPPGYFSNATLNFTFTDVGRTLFKLTHKRILAHELERVEAGWRRMFLSPIKQLFQI